MKRLPVIYIAGPYRAPTPWQIQEHIRRAQAVALRVWKMGAVAICPHANTALFDGEADDAIWLEGDLELLRRSDAVVLLNGWERSRGATAERTFAEQQEIPIFLEPYMGLALPMWINEWTRNRVAPTVVSTAANAASA